MIEGGYASTSAVPARYLNIRCTYNDSCTKDTETRDIAMLLGIWKRPSTAFSKEIYGARPFTMSLVVASET